MVERRCTGMCAKQVLDLTWGDVKKKLVTDDQGVIDSIEEVLRLHDYKNIPHSNKKLHKLDYWLINELLAVGVYDVLGEQLDKFEVLQLFYSELISRLNKQCNAIGLTLKGNVLFQVGDVTTRCFEVEYTKPLEDLVLDELNRVNGVVFNIGLVGVKDGFKLPICYKLGVIKHDFFFFDGFGEFAIGTDFIDSHLEKLIFSIMQTIKVTLFNTDFRAWYLDNYGSVEDYEHYNTLYEQYLEMEGSLG